MIVVLASKFGSHPHSAGTSFLQPLQIHLSIFCLVHLEVPGEAEAGEGE